MNESTYLHHGKFEEDRARIEVETFPELIRRIHTFHYILIEGFLEITLEMFREYIFSFLSL